MGGSTAVGAAARLGRRLPHEGRPARSRQPDPTPAAGEWRCCHATSCHACAHCLRAGIDSRFPLYLPLDCTSVNSRPASKNGLSGAAQNDLSGAQAVHELYDVTEGAAWPSDEPRMSKVVVIGRRLQRAQLETGLRRCAL